jgi:hypothetical protein
MTPKIISVKPVDDYQIEIIYHNKEKRVLNIKPLLKKGKFSELKDKAFFDSARVSFDTIEWSNGIVIDPEDIYKTSLLVENIS